MFQYLQSLDSVSAPWREGGAQAYPGEESRHAQIFLDSPSQALILRPPDPSPPPSATPSPTPSSGGTCIVRPRHPRMHVRGKWRPAVGLFEPR